MMFFMVIYNVNHYWTPFFTWANNIFCKNIDYVFSVYKLISVPVRIGEWVGGV